MSERRTKQAHDLVAQVTNAGDTVVDATAGNGHDTVFLAQLVGPGGRVFCFDIQSQALAATRVALDAAGGGLASRVALILADHATMAARLPMATHGRIAAVMFNLGYLPGGNKQITTKVQSTLTAVRDGAAMLRPGGVLTVVGYVGHEAGQHEVDQLESSMASASLPLTWHEHDPRTEPSRAPRLFVGIKTQGQVRSARPRRT